MDAAIPLLVFGQALGASIGALAAVWGELAYVRALKDGAIDRAERAHLDALAHGLRFGMSLILLSSLGLVILAYALRAGDQPALSASYWTLVALALLIVGVSWALSRRRVSFALGSAIVFTAWWFLAYLVFGRLPALTFGSAVAFFVVAATIFYIALRWGRSLVLRKS